MIGDHPAEQLLSKILLKNKLASEEQLQEVYDNKDEWDTTNFADQLVQECIIKEAILAKVLPVIKKKGAALPEYEPKQFDTSDLFGEDESKEEESPKQEAEETVEDYDPFADDEPEEKEAAKEEPAPQESYDPFADDESDNKEPAASPPTPPPAVEAPQGNVIEMSSGDSDEDSGLGFVDDAPISTEYRPPEPMHMIGQSGPSIGAMNYGAPAATYTTETEGEEEAYESQLMQDTICNPAGDGKQLLKLLKQANELDSSDLHLSPYVEAFVRSKGQLVRLNTPKLKPKQIENILFDLINSNQKQKLIDELQLDFSLELPDGTRYRSNIVKDRVGWAACFRIIAKEVPNFEKLGLPPQAKTLTEYNTGLVLITGPKGCGKTTTMAAMIDLINRSRKDHIITMEDPIEFKHPSRGCQVSQRSLGSHTMSYANALRGALRQDPDVMLVGEMRDVDTISMAITAAETGHLVFGSLHTNSAARTIDRVISAFPPDQQSQIRVMVAESIRGVICQELLPRADGDGLVMAYEILLNNVSVRKTIVDGRTFQLESTMQTSKKQGMVRMDDNIMELLDNKLITKETAQIYMRNPKVLN